MSEPFSCGWKVLLLCLVTSDLAFGAAVSAQVVTWGDTSHGENNIPLSLSNVVAIANGVDHGLALNGDGTVVGWGNTLDGAATPPSGLTNVVAIAAGDFHGLALKSDGTVAAWGYSGYGQISVAYGLKNVAAIAGGGYHSLALKTDGTVTAWGLGDFGEISVPLGLRNVVAISGGEYCSLALKTDGTVVAWGDNSYGETNIPAGLTNVVSIAAGTYHCLALKGDGTVVAWGYNFDGQASVPAGLSNVVAIAAGYNHSLALKSDGTVVAWGDNSHGETSVPAWLTNVVSIAAGEWISVALVGDSPFIVKQPVGQTAYSGSPVVLASRAVGRSLLRYQWQFNESNIAGATNASLILSNVAPAISGNYRLMVDDAVKTVTTFTVPLVVVTSAPVITAQSTLNQIFDAGSNAVLSLTAIGSLPMSFQWQFNGDEIPGETNGFLSLTNLQYADEGTYGVVVSNQYGVAASSNMVLRVMGLDRAVNATDLVWTTGGDTPWIWETNITHDGIAAARSGVLVFPFQTSILQTTVTGPGTLNFKWKVSSQLGGLLMFGETVIFGEVAWQQQTYYLTEGTQPLQWMYYRSIFYDPAGLDSGFLDEVSYWPGATPPTFTTFPADQAVPAGTNVTFSFAVVGTPPLSYQWQFNGIGLTGATNRLLTITNVQATNAGSYSVVVSSPYGITNSSATLTVTPASPTILTQPRNQRLLVNATAIFNVTAKGSEPFSYQWLFNGNQIDGATNSTLTLTSLRQTNSGNYQVLVSNAPGAVASSNASLVVAPSLVFAWGNNFYGQANVPLALTNPVAIAAGLYHSLALRNDGTVVGWGYNAHGEINAPVALSNVVAIAAGYNHSLALKGDGTVVAWGYNNFGQTNVPAGLTNVVAIASGTDHSLALKGDGTVVGWGYNAHGEINAPVALSNAVAIAAGYNHSLALKGDGTVVAWGYNKLGQTNVPAGLSNVVAIVAGADHSLALKSDGTLVAWGSNAYGQTDVPAGLSNLVAIAARFFHNLGLGSDGTVLTWGRTEGTVPPGLSNVVAIAAGDSHSLALVNDGAPFVVRQSLDQMTSVGSNVIFGVTAIGSPPLAYQWLFNGSNIEGATNAVLVFTNAPLTSSGVYQCIVSNAFGTVTNSPATLAVLRTTPDFGSTSSNLQLSDAGFSVQLNGLSGHGSILFYASTNLADWIPIFTNPPLSGTLKLLDSSATNYPFRFYRAVEQ